MAFGKQPLDIALAGLNDGDDMLQKLRMVMAPLTPTQEMIEAGCAVTNLNPVEVRVLYEVMIRATLPELSEGILP